MLPASVPRFATGGLIKNSSTKAVIINSRNGRGTALNHAPTLLETDFGRHRTSSTNPRTLRLDTHKLCVSCWYLQRSFRFFVAPQKGRTREPRMSELLCSALVPR